MDQKQMLFLTVVVVACGLGVFVVQPAEDQSRSPFVEPGKDKSYTASMALYVNGEQFVKFNVKQNTNSETMRVTAVFQQVRSTTYWHRNTSITRVTAETEKKYREVLASKNSNEIVVRDDADRTIISRTNQTHRPSVGTGLLFSILSYPEFERIGTKKYNNGTMAVYGAQSGWYEVRGATGNSAVRVTDASGVVYVSTETNSVYYSNVTFQATKATTVGEYVLNRHINNQSSRLKVSLTYRYDNVSINRPTWAESIESPTHPL